MSRTHSSQWADAAAPRVLAVTTTFRTAEVSGPMRHVPNGRTIVLETGDEGVLSRVLEAVSRTTTVLREDPPDVVLLDAPGLSGIFVALVLRLAGVPFALRLAGDPWRTSDGNAIQRARREDGVLGAVAEYAYGLMNRGIIRLAAGFLPVSSALGEVARERTGCSADRVQVVPVPIKRPPDGDAAAGRRSLGVDESAVVLTVTNLHFADKFNGVVDALEGVMPLLEEREDLAYVVAGRGYYLEPLRERVDEVFEDSPAREQVYVPGYVDDVFDCYALADVFLYVSYIDGYPNAVLEAQSMGLPVIANPALGMLDQISDGETGLFVDPAAPESITLTLSQLLDDGELRDRLGDAARQRTVRENEPEAVGQRLETALQTILAATAR
jgi:glycosyltransferase involved in cell wall biosynthesis